MKEEFLVNIRALYRRIVEKDDPTLIKEDIKKIRGSFNIKDDLSLGEFYVKICSRKDKGVVYTPAEISDFIVSSTVNAEDIIHNPFLRILEPSCGCGNILIRCFIHLKEIYTVNIQEINKRSGINLSVNNINEHIIKNNLFGVDVDVSALMILTIDQYEISGGTVMANLINGDFLIEESSEKFDIIIGNPPYVGHKTIDSSYSTLLREKYGSVLSDKGDLFYCFVSKAMDCLSPNGKITFITSRYFMESSSGRGLRKLLSEDWSVNKIVDYYGVRPFKNAGIDPVILFIDKAEKKVDSIEVIKPAGEKSSDFISYINNGIETTEFKRFFINRSELSGEPWILVDEKERAIIKKIQARCTSSLQDICLSKQGIITGCDKAFIVDRSTIEEKRLEEQVIKPWIKSSNIERNGVRRGSLFLINTDNVDDISNFPNISEHIALYKEKLVRRRECEKGIRKWYGLQWGREERIFEENKIIFPYKANHNIFAIDSGNYFSADVYSLIIKEGSKIEYDYLKYILNSKIYEFYFKRYAKKLGSELYEYYPNTLMKLKIPTMRSCDLDGTDFSLYEYFELTSEERKIVENVVTG